MHMPKEDRQLILPGSIGHDDGQGLVGVTVLGGEPPPWGHVKDAGLCLLHGHHRQVHVEPRVLVDWGEAAGVSFD